MFKLTKQQVQFAAVGIANTVVDFTILNILATGLGWRRTVANTVSVTVAIALSYYANNRFVFGDGKHSIKKLWWFLIITIISAYFIQNGTILFFTRVWTWPIDVIASVVDWAGINLSADVIATNASKAIAVVFGAVFNYVFYKRFVFSDG